MINVLTKYKSGGVTSAEKAQFDEAFKMAAKNAGIDENSLIEVIRSVQDGNEQKEKLTTIAMAAKGDQNAIKAIQGWFNKNGFKSGGKVHDFICKHSIGGRVDCGCNGTKIRFGRDGVEDLDLKTDGVRKAKKNAKRVRDNSGIERRTIGQYQDKTGNYIYEWGDVNGNTAETGIRATPNDTTFFQKIPTSYGYRVITGNQDSPQWYNGMAKRMRPILNSEVGQNDKIIITPRFSLFPATSVSSNLSDVSLQKGGDIPEGYNLSRREVIKRLMSDNGLSRMQAAQEYDKRARRIGTDSQGRGVSPIDFGVKGTSREQIAYDLLNSGMQGDYRKEYRKVLRGMRRNSDLSDIGYGNYRAPEFGRNRNDGSLKQLAKEAVKAKHPLSTILRYNYETEMPNIRPARNSNNSTTVYDIYTPEYKESLINGSSYYDPNISYNSGVDTRMYRSADGTTLNFGPNGGSIKRAYDKKGGKIKNKK